MLRTATQILAAAVVTVIATAPVDRACRRAYDVWLCADRQRDHRHQDGRRLNRQAFSDLLSREVHRAGQVSAERRNRSRARELDRVIA